MKAAENLTSSFYDSFQVGINSYITNWISEHPVIFWILNHPIQSLLILLFLIFVIIKLLKILSKVFEKILAFVLQAPFKLIKAFWDINTKFFGNLVKNKLVGGQSEEIDKKSDRQEKIDNILSRLDLIKQEQETLLQELAVLIKSDKPESTQNSSNGA